MIQNKLTIIEAKGTPYEIGLKHGSLGKKEVLKSIENYTKMFKTYAKIDWEEAKTTSRQYIEKIEEFDKNILEEMKGIADGAGVELEDILALNARSEVILMSNRGAQLDGCTSLVALPEYTSEGNTLLAQNWDWKEEQRQALIYLTIESPNHPKIMMITEGGIVGKIGFNSSGLGVCLNALGMDNFNPEGVPLHVVLRGILNSSTLSDAIKRVNEIPNACAANYLMGHGGGEAVSLEKAPHDFDILYPSEGTLVHSNHFITPRLRSKDTSRFMFHDTFVRYGRADRLIRKEVGKIDVESFKKILSDHVEYPDSICRHSDPKDDPEERMCTVFSIIMDLTNLKMHFCYGPPCSNAFITLE